MTQLKEFSTLTSEAKLGISKLEALLKHLLLPQGPGARIYQEKHLSWLFQPAMRQQLPPLYHFFAKYCAFQHRFSKKQVILGDYVLMIVIGLTKFFRLRKDVQLSIAGYTVFLDLCDPRMLKVPNELTKSENSSLKFFLFEGDTFVDLGANHGSFSIVAAQLVSSTGLIVAIEPQPHLAKLLEESLAANVQCKYQLCTIACGDRNGYIDFYVPTRTSGSAGIHPAYSAISTHCKLSVPLKRFDDAVDWQHFPGHVLIKIDLSGNERYVPCFKYPKSPLICS